MKTSVLLTLIGAFAAGVQQASAECSTPEWGQCSTNDGSVACCPDGYYCQPWTPNYFQCQQKPAKCQKQYTNVDFIGNDIATIFSLQPGDCCARCTQTKGCVAYTFVNYRASPTACYLKRAAGKQKAMTGAVSGIVADADDDRSGSTVDDGSSTPRPPTPPPNKCATNAWGWCGDQTKSFCCPDGQYCQPWNPGFYQCMQTPAKCPTQFTDIEFPGNDIGKARAGTGDQCCAACARNSRCKAYAFVNFNPSVTNVCYLKSSAGDGKGKRKVGAVSGRR